ncbi:MAG: hypothetical protein OEY64_03285 [Nitrospinota bacterium]|nr:hypothetical protein [Nitrospinota bacterium]
MDHRAEQITAKILTLVTGLATTGANVGRDVLDPLEDTELPFLSVAQGEDTKMESSFEFIDSSLTVIITAYLKANSALTTTLNQIRKEIAIALSADYTLGLAWVLDSNEGDVSAPELLTDAEKGVARQDIAWHVHYRRSRTDPST